MQEDTNRNTVSSRSRSNTNPQTNGKGYNSQNAQEGEGISIAQIWWLTTKLKWWLLASVVGCLIVALAALRYATPRYQVFAKILIKDQTNQRSYSSSINNTFAELGMMNSSNGFDNELEVLATLTLNQQVVKELGLYTRYYFEGTIKDREIYGQYAPYQLSVDPLLIDTLDRSLQFTMEDTEGGLLVTVEYEDFLDNEREDKHLVTGFPATITTPLGDFVIQRNPLIEVLSQRIKAGVDDEELLNAAAKKRNSSEAALLSDNPYALQRRLIAYVHPLQLITAYYTKRLSVEGTSKLTTIAQLVMEDNIPLRAKDYLTRLLDAYNEDATIDNNIEALRTAEFIDERLGVISLELGTSEESLEQYKKAAGITDLGEDAKVDVGQNIIYEQQLVENEQQLSLVGYLIDYVENPENRYHVIPSNVGLKDNALISALTKHNETVIGRDNLLRSMAESSPQVESLTTQVDGYLAAIKASLQSMKGQLTIENRAIRSQQQKYTGKISSTPGKERAMAEITRQQEVKAGLYLMLLQKREENAITLASNAYKGKLIEQPIATTSPVAPKKKLILLVALIFGIALPFGVYYLKQLFRFRVEDAEDLGTLTNIPLLGTVPLIKQLVKSERTVVIQENRNSLIMEVFRALRMNLPFVLKKGENVILLTSTNSGEGKTIVSSNLSASLAIAGKRVVIIGADIRKPRLAALFNLSDSGRGLNDFLSHDPEDTAFIDKLIQPSGVNANLDVLPAGTVPPNPAELLERENFGIAINYLRQRYDYVIIDSAPIGMVADTLTVAQHADLCLYVVRANYTLRSDIQVLESLRQSGRLPNVNIVLNGEKYDPSASAGQRYGKYGYGKRYGYGKSYSYGYGYGHSYGYGYGYGQKKGEKLPEI